VEAGLHFELDREYIHREYIHKNKNGDLDVSAANRTGFASSGMLY
jgi:hypothetical protein